MQETAHPPIPEQTIRSYTRLRTLIASWHPRQLSIAEKVFFGVLLIVVICSGYLLLHNLYGTLLVEVPARGGSFTEGIVGTPRFINPVLASSQADRDLTALVYSGLMKTNATGTLVPALAESYTISDDNLIYTFTIRTDARFHDGTPVTADDVIFTLSRIQEPRTKSPLFVNWEGVQVEKVNEHTVRFTLAAPYAPFLYNTTVGILPKARWEAVGVEEMPFSTLNTMPIGSGPFEVADVTRDGAGMPEAYALTRFTDYMPAPAFLDRITIYVFGTDEALAQALRKGDVEAVGGLRPSTLLDIPQKNAIHTETLPRVFAVFYNQNTNAALADKNARAALDRILPKGDLIERVLLGRGTALKGPLLPLFTAEATTTETSVVSDASSTETLSPEEETAKRLEDAEAIMTIGGWKKGDDGIWEKNTKKENLRLAFTLVTSDVPELADMAQDIKEVWHTFGAEVTLMVVDPDTLAREVIRPRKYDALFFGEVVGRALDLYPFWHSSQRNDPGLNVALYTNLTADKALETLRASQDEKKRADALRVFLREVKIDAPAAFVFAPAYLYTTPTSLKNISLVSMENPEDRFQNVSEWYIETDRIWPFVNEWLGE